MRKTIQDSGNSLDENTQTIYVSKTLLFLTIVAIISLLIIGFLLLYHPVVSSASPPVPELWEYHTTGADTAMYVTSGDFMAQEFSSFDSDIFPTGVKLRMYKTGNPGDIVVSIYDNWHNVNSYGAIYNGALCSVTKNINDMTTSTSGEWYWFNFTQWGGDDGIGIDPTLHEDERYFIVVTHETSVSDNRVYWRFDYGFLWTAPYPGGGDNSYEKWHGAKGQHVNDATAEDDTFLFQLYGISSEPGDIDQFDVYGANGITDTDSYAVDSTNWVAGRFSPYTDYLLYSVEILAVDQGTGNVTVSIRNGTATTIGADDWVSSSFDVGVLHTWYQHDMWVKVEFNETIHVREGNYYYIIIQGCPEGYVWVRYDTSSGYTSRVQTSSDAGATWMGGQEYIPYKWDYILFRTIGFEFEAILPEDPIISINSGNSSTDDVNVTLTLSCDNADTMQFRNESGAWSLNESYAITKNWVLSEGYGQKTVEVRYWNINGSASASDDIAYLLTAMNVSNPNPANNSVGISVQPHMSVTLNNSNGTMLRIYYSYAPGFGGHTDWSLLANETVAEQGVVWFNDTETLLSGVNYSWYVEATNLSTMAVMNFPIDEGTLITPGLGMPWGEGTPHLCWDFFTTSVIANMTIEYPVEGVTYTEAQWELNHDVLVNVTNNTIQHNLSFYMTVSFSTGDDWVDQETIRISSELFPGIDGVAFYDLKRYVPYDECDYSIYIEAYDYDNWGNITDNPALRAFIAPNAEAYVNFTVNEVSTVKHQRIALTDAVPSHGEIHGIDAVSNGFTVSLATNCSKKYPELWYFIVKPDDTGAYDNTNIVAYGRKTANTWHTDMTMGLGKFTPREHYRVYIGAFTDGTPPGSTIQWARDGALLAKGTISLYGDSAWYIGGNGIFSYEWNNFRFPKRYWVFDGALLGGELGGDAQFWGFVIDFYTYPEGEEPDDTTLSDGDTLTGSDWGHDLVEPLGIDGIEIVIGIFIVFLFSLMPYLFIKRKGKDVPLPVLTTFAGFGSIMAYGMGFFPLWFFVIPIFLCILTIVYKVASWILGKKELVGG